MLKPHQNSHEIIGLVKVPEIKTALPEIKIALPEIEPNMTCLKLQPLCWKFRQICQKSELPETKTTLQAIETKPV